MNKNEAKNIVNDSFNGEFSELAFKKFIDNLLKKYSKLDKIREEGYLREAFRDYVSKYKVIGFFQDKNENKIDVLQVYLKKIPSLDRARTIQRNFVADYLKNNRQGKRDAALVAFIAPNEEDWRFSLVKLEYSLDLKDGNLKAKEELTPAKRWSFLLGKNEKNHTVKSRFLSLLESDEEPVLSEIEQAFNIEKVTNEFFNKYFALFLKMKDSLDDLLNKDPELKKDFEYKEISTSDFAKKTLGQLVFLYFLQKKGWFGVRAGEPWGTGRKNFLRELFCVREKYGSNFFDDVLEPLFYEALSLDRGASAIYSKLNNCRMPFLNGGLFEPMNNYSWQTTHVFLPDELFSNKNKTEEGDVGDGILDVFDRYNFTVNENEPLEKEVAVDPEMLGKVFENLLEIKDRKNKGAFYTPREIVHYMSQESLINYLFTQVNESISKIDIEFFIRKGIEIIQNDKTVLEKNKETDTYKFMLPQSIRNKALELDKLLENIKVCDPAVGSGAFPLGMLNEIVRARLVLAIHNKKNVSPYNLKLHTISNSLYGVDLDSGAVDIAKLRMWLSLVVEEEEPHPLPNLDYKIMQGNSLLSEYEGIKLFDDSIFEEMKDVDLDRNKLQNNLSVLQKEYFELHSLGNLTNEKKQEIEKEIKFLNEKLDSVNYKKIVAIENNSLFGVEDNQNVIQEKIKILEYKIKKFVDESRRSNKEALKNEIDNLKWELIELSMQGDKGQLDKIKYFRKKNIRPFFIWKLEFSEVFKEKGGFDVVIGNPPYIQLQKDGGVLGKMFENSGYESFSKTGDIYCLFYELGNRLLADQGHLAFITSNKWMRSGYGEKLRKYLSENSTPLLLIDLGPSVFETATVDTNILLFEKGKNDRLCNGCSVKENLVKKDIHLRDYIDKNKIIIKNFSSGAWIILSEIEKNIKEKIERVGKPLKDWDIEINYGVKTGCNEAFIIDGKKKDELISKDPKSSEIIKPILRGKDIKRYYADFADLWLIATFPALRLNIDSFPAVKEYLLSFGKKLEQTGMVFIDENEKKQKTRKKTGNKWFETQDQISYYEEFRKEKIVWPMVSTGQCVFTIVHKGFYLNNKCYLITGTNLLFFISILNSKISWWYFKNQESGLGKLSFEIRKNGVENFPVPFVDKKDQELLINLVNNIINITSVFGYNPKNPPIRQKELEAKIDELVFDIYGLTQEEREIVLKS